MLDVVNVMVALGIPFAIRQGVTVSAYSTDNRREPCQLRGYEAAGQARA